MNKPEPYLNLDFKKREKKNPCKSTECGSLSLSTGLRSNTQAITVTISLKKYVKKQEKYFPMSKEFKGRFIMSLNQRL